MYRRSPLLLLAIIAALLLGLSACAGKSTTKAGNETVQRVLLNPDTNVSLDLGSTNQTFVGTAFNSLGQAIPATIHYRSSNNASLTIANNGQACAGTWDSLSSPVVCTPGVVGVAQVTAVVGGISSPPATVYVHQHIDNLAVSPLGNPFVDCFSLNDQNPQNRGWTYQATAFSNGVDITNTVGPMSWTSTQPNVLTLGSQNFPTCPAPSGQPPCNQIQITAKDPGITNLSAAAGNASSSPVQVTTCLVGSVLLQAENNLTNTILLNNSGTQSIQASVFDSRNNPVSNPSLTWGSTNPEVVTVTATSTNGKNTVSGKTNAGGANVFAACEPPSCNIGVVPAMPIYSVGGLLLNGTLDLHPPNQNDRPAFGSLAVNVTVNKIPSYVGWTATTDCFNLPNCTSAAFSVVNSSSNPIGAAVTLPFTPNSFRITPDGTTGYLGSDQGLMIINSLSGNPTVSTANGQSTPCNVVLCGEVLAISSDSKRIVIGDRTSDPNQVYIYSSGASPVDLVIPGATAAAFSPEGLKLFIISNTGALYIYSTLDALAQVPLSAPATDLAFAADGSFAYLLGNPAGDLSAYGTCNGAPLGSPVGLTGTPLRIFPVPDTTETPQDVPIPSSQIVQDLVAVSPPNVQLVKATFTRDPIPDGQTKCNNPQLTLSAGKLLNIGQGSFTPLLIQFAGSGQQYGEHIIIVAQGLPAVVDFDVLSGTSTNYPLAGGGYPLSASASPDGSQIFVATCDQPLKLDQDGKNYRCFPIDPNNPPGGEIHIVNTALGGDIQQTPYNNPDRKGSMCFDLDPVEYPCVPNLVAVRPQ